MGTTTHTESLTECCNISVDISQHPVFLWNHKRQVHVPPDCTEVDLSYYNESVGYIYTLNKLSLEEKLLVLDNKEVVRYK